MFYIVDPEDEDCLYTAHWFEEAFEPELLVEAVQALTIHLNSAAKVAIREMGEPPSLSLLTWPSDLLDEWLDLPSPV